MNVKKIVSNIIDKVGSNDLDDIIAYFNIEVIEIDLGSDTQGMYKYLKRNKFIFINSGLDYNERKVVLAHELGHALLHTRLDCFFLSRKTLFIQNKFEIEADKFAAELLISDDDIKELDINYTVEQAAVILNVPVALLLYKLNK